MTWFLSYRKAKYKIEGSKREFVLSKLQFNKNTQEDEWQVIGYYNDLYYLLKYFVKLQLIDTKIHNDIKEQFEKTLKDITKKLEISK